MLYHPMFRQKPRGSGEDAPPLHYFDSAQRLQRMQAEGCSRAEMARLTGLTVPQVIDRLALLTLDEGLRAYLRQAGAPEGISQLLLMMPDQVSRWRMACRIVREQLCIRDAALLVRSARRRWMNGEAENHRQHVITAIRDIRPYRNAIRDIAEQMKSAGVRATFVERRSGGMLELTVAYPVRRRRAERFHAG